VTDSGPAQSLVRSWMNLSGRSAHPDPGAVRGIPL
jgi:hypothetical protein